MPRTPTSDPSGADTSSRRDRLVATRRKSRTRIIVSVLVVGIAGGLAAAAYAYYSSDSEAHAAPPTGRAGKFGYVIGVNRLDEAHETALRQYGADIVVLDLEELL